jgi:hypothetical protein
VVVNDAADGQMLEILSSTGGRSREDLFLFYDYFRIGVFSFPTS